MKKIIVFVLLAISSYVSADYNCEGKITYLGVDNALRVNNGYGVHTLCSLDVDSQKDKCKAWLSMALSAQAQNRTIAIYYRDSTGKQSSTEVCNSVGNWVSPSDPVYFFRII
jgi:hypothetical protein